MPQETRAGSGRKSLGKPVSSPARFDEGQARQPVQGRGFPAAVYSPRMSSTELWNSGWPDWKDAGRRVVVERAGVLAEGILSVEDFGYDGQDEYPIWGCTANDGSLIDFAGADHWRFVSSAE